METNESLRSGLLKQAESSMAQLVVSLQAVAEGDLQELEQQVMVQMLELGRVCLEHILSQQAKAPEPIRQREGECGHPQRLVGIRPRQILTLFGPMTIPRAYYQCKRTQEQREDQEGEQENACKQGVAPFDRDWGLTGQRSSPGLQKVVSYLSARLTHEEVADAIGRLLPVQISARQVGNVIQPKGEAFRQWEDQEVHDLLQRGTQKRLSEEERQEEQGAPIKRMYVEMDGVMARLRRGSVPMERLASGNAREMSIVRSKQEPSL